MAPDRGGTTKGATTAIADASITRIAHRRRAPPWLTVIASLLRS
jgi:hypothetical protein